jgi:3',5'-cyclic AMP phosphodiesterase CpdA
MTRLFHVSDVHFGREDAEAIAWFGRKVQEEQPDAIIMTGDLTMRARAAEFAAAGQWLASLGRPVTVEVGNHDLPYFNLWARFVTPYKRYRAVEQASERPLDLPGVTVVPLKTTARFQPRLNWSKGYVSRHALKTSLALVQGAPAGDVVLVAAHHPLVEGGTRMSSETHRGPLALATLAAAGADAVLTGHVHDPFDIAHEVGGRTVRLIGAGTLSTRTRAKPPSFNVLTIEGGDFTTVARFKGEGSVAL